MSQIRLIPGLGSFRTTGNAEVRLLPNVGAYVFEQTGEPGPEDHIVNLGNAPQIGIDISDPTVDAIIRHQVDLGNAPQIGIDVGIPTVEVPDAVQHIVNLGNAPTLGLDVSNPTTDFIVRHQVILVNAPQSGLDVSDPTTDFVVQHQVDLGNAPTIGVDVGIPTVNAGEDAIVNLGNAPVIGVDVPDPIIDAQITHFVDLGNAPVIGLDVSSPTVEGVPDLPPTIITPTPDQVLTFGFNGVIPPPEYDQGTGTSPIWTIATDDFSTQPGVNTLTINPVTGALTIGINPLTATPAEQALNINGPYTVTRRLTTTIAHADDDVKILVNVGNYTLDMTPGTHCVTWNTKTANARGLEAGMDLSPTVMQTYTVT